MAHDQDLASAYELIYVVAAGKNYQREAHDVAALIRQRHPTADSLLDVACGTGLHLSHLRNSFAHVEGLELVRPDAQGGHRATRRDRGARRGHA